MLTDRPRLNTPYLPLHQTYLTCSTPCPQAIDADGLCETAHVHMAHLMLQKSEWAVAIESFDAALALLRVKQEVEETFAMREAAAAQQALLTAQPEIYKPAMERQRAAMANMG